MAGGALDTTNALLTTLVVISVLEALALAVVVVGMMRLYRQMLAALHEMRHELRPLAERAHNLATSIERIAADVSATTARAASGAAAVGAAFQTAVGVAQLARGSAARSVVARALPLLGLAKGLRAAYRTFVGSRVSHERATSPIQDGRGRREHPDANVHSSMTGKHTREAAHGT